MAWYTDKLDIFTIKWGDSKYPKSAIEVNSNGYQHTTITIKNTKTGKTGELVLIYYPKIDKVTIGSLSTDGRSKFYLTIKDFLDALEMPEDLWKSFWQGGKKLFKGFRLSIPVDAGITFTADTSIFKITFNAVTTPKGLIKFTYYDGMYGFPVTFTPAPVYRQKGITSKYLSEILAYAGITEDVWNSKLNLPYDAIFTKDLTLQREYENARYTLKKSIKSALGYIYYPNVKKTECPEYPITGFISGPISKKWPDYFHYRYWYKTEKGDVIEFRYGTKFLFYKPTKTIYVLAQGPHYDAILSFRKANNIWPDYTIASEKPSKDILLEISPCLASQYSDFTGTYNYEYVRITYSKKLKVYKIEVLSTGWSDGEPTSVGENIGKLIKDLESKGCVRNDEVDFNKLINDHTSTLLEEIKEFKESVVSNIVAPTHPFDINILKQNKDPEMMRDAPVSSKSTTESETAKPTIWKVEKGDYDLVYARVYPKSRQKYDAGFIVDKKQKLIYNVNPAHARAGVIKELKKMYPNYKFTKDLPVTCGMNPGKTMYYCNKGNNFNVDHNAKTIYPVTKGTDYDFAVKLMTLYYPDYKVADKEFKYKTKMANPNEFHISRYIGNVEYDRAEIKFLKVYEIKDEKHYFFQYTYRKLFGNLQIEEKYVLQHLLMKIGYTKEMWEDIKAQITNSYIRMLNWTDSHHIIIKKEEKKPIYRPGKQYQPVKEEPKPQPKPQLKPQPKPQPKPIPQPAPQPTPEPEPQPPVRPEIGEEEGGKTEKGNIGPFLILGGLIALLWYIFH